MNQVLSKFATFKLIVFLIRNIFSNASNLVSSFLFANTMLILLKISFGNVQTDESIYIGTLFCAVFLSMTIISGSIIDDLLRSGLLKNILLIGLSDILISFSLFGALLIANIVLSTFVLLSGALMFNFEFNQLLWMIIIIIFSLPIITITLLFISQISGIHKQNFLNLILAFPFLIPILIITAKSYNDSSYIELLFGTSLIYLPLFFYLSSRLIRI